jgi:ribosomal protein S27AE
MEELISKQEALASIKALYPNIQPKKPSWWWKWLEKCAPYFECENAIEQLQPVKQETVTEFADRCRECGKMRTGHWVEETINLGHKVSCSKCGSAPPFEHISSGDVYNKTKFCPNCGAKMVEIQERSEV